MYTLRYLYIQMQHLLLFEFNVCIVFSLFLYTHSVLIHVCIQYFLFIFRCTYCVLFILNTFSLYPHVCTHYLGIIFKCTHCILFILTCNYRVLFMFRCTHYFSILDVLYEFSVASIVMKFLHEIQFHRLLSNYF